MECPTISMLPKPPCGRTGWPWTKETARYVDREPEYSSVPLISVTTPSYNQREYLEETIRSVLLQGYPRLELVVIDGGSTDGSVDIIERYEEWLTYWISENDEGQSHAINKGWRRSSGDILAYLNSDDTYMPGTLWEIARAWQRESAHAVYVGGIAITDEQSNILKCRNTPVLPQPAPIDLTVVDPKKWRLPQQSGFFNRSRLEEVGCFVREDLHYTMDRELYYRLLSDGTISIIDNDIATFRQHRLSKSDSEIEKMYKEDLVALGFVSARGWWKQARKYHVGRLWKSRGCWKLATRDSISIQIKCKNLIRVAYYRPSELFNKKYWVQVAKLLNVYPFLIKLKRVLSTRLQ